MQTFLSWSGERSRHVAEALRAWLPHVINAVKPWMSGEDIETGARWSAEIAEQLSGTQFGIVCLTPENLLAPWILFEAGALSKTVERVRVCPYLFAVQPADIKGPLVQFQSTPANKEGTLRLVHALNRGMGEPALSPTHVDEAFEVWWPRLDQRLGAIPKAPSDSTPVRSDREILEELLELVRKEARSTHVAGPAATAIDVEKMPSRTELKRALWESNSPAAIARRMGIPRPQIDRLLALYEIQAEGADAETGL